MHTQIPGNRLTDEKPEKTEKIYFAHQQHRHYPPILYILLATCLHIHRGPLDSTAHIHYMIEESTEPALTSDFSPAVRCGPAPSPGRADGRCNLGPDTDIHCRKRLPSQRHRPSPYLPPTTQHGSSSLDTVLTSRSCLTPISRHLQQHPTSCDTTTECSSSSCLTSLQPKTSCLHKPGCRIRRHYRFFLISRRK